MTRKIISANIEDTDCGEIILRYSNGDISSETLFYPEGEVVQIDDGCVVGHTASRDEWDIIDAELKRYSKETLGVVEAVSIDFEKLASDWVSKNVVLAEHCDIEYQDVTASLIKLLKSVVK